MKIPRLFTPEQFKDYLKEKLPLKEGSINMIKAGRWDLMNSFLEYQKQSLKKEMFVNELELGIVPNTEEDITDEYLEKLVEYEEAEKKVIFNCPFRDNGNIFEINKLEYVNSEFDSLGSLATMTNGNLELQNVEL